MPFHAENAGGSYAEKHRSSRLLAFSHGERFATARRLVLPYAGKSILDYGCGDGTFLASVKDHFPSLTGTDADPNQLAHCRSLLPKGTFLEPSAVRGRFGVLTCLEVLEHVLEEQRGRLLDRLKEWLEDDGVLIVSVPIETGPVVLFKEAARWVVGRRHPDYRAKEVYGWGELARQVFAGPETRVAREVWNGGHGHKGFHWRRLEREIAARFVVRGRTYSPLPRLGPWLNSQVWWVLGK